MRLATGRLRRRPTDELRVDDVDLVDAAASSAAASRSASMSGVGDLLGASAYVGCSEKPVQLPATSRLRNR